jgi:hypothetical protein
MNANPVCDLVGFIFNLTQLAFDYTGVLLLFVNLNIAPVYMKKA